MSELWHRPRWRNKNVRVTDVDPLAIRQFEDPDRNVGLPPVAGRIKRSIRVVPGIGTGAAYQDGDVMGTIIEFPGLFRPNINSGILYAARLIDLDDEGLQIDLHLFSRSIASPGADNAAFSPTDADVATSYVGTLEFTSFSNFGSNQVSMAKNVGFDVWSFAPNGSLFGHAVTRGASNIAAGNLPMFQLSVLPD